MRILVAEDDPASRQYLQSKLVEWGHEVTTAAGGDVLRGLQATDAASVVIVGWNAADLDGEQVCRTVRTREGRYVYLLVSADSADKSELIRGLAAGADDYLTKPYDALELRARLLAAQRFLDLHTKLAAARETMQELASLDSLTGVWNHRTVMDLLGREITRGKRENRPVGVLFADVDHFKRVNDRHGHVLGDAVLKEAARRMATAIRPYDSVGRYGGDEFIIVAAGCGQAEAATMAERIRKQVSGFPVPVDNMPIPVTVSIGATVAPPGTNPAAVMASAEAALAAAKAGGRNRVAFAAPPGQPRLDPAGKPA